MEMPHTTGKPVEVVVDFAVEMEDAESNIYMQETHCLQLAKRYHIDFRRIPRSQPQWSKGVNILCTGVKFNPSGLREGHQGYSVIGIVATGMEISWPIEDVLLFVPLNDDPYIHGGDDATVAKWKREHIDRSTFTDF
jgi:hypothetical protein